MNLPLGPPKDKFGDHAHYGSGEISFSLQHGLAKTQIRPKFSF